MVLRDVEKGKGSGTTREDVDLLINLKMARAVARNH